MSTYPILDPDAPAHDHHRNRDCAACWTVITLLAEQAMPLVNAAADDVGGATSRLDRILGELAAHHAQTHLLHELAALVAAIQPGRVGLSYPAAPGGSRAQAAVTVTNELLEAAAARDRTGAPLEALWALEPAGRRDVAAILGYSAGMLLAQLPARHRQSTLLLLSTPLPPGTLRAVPAAGAVSALLAEGRHRDALNTYTRASTQPGLLRAMATAWAACLTWHRGRRVLPTAGRAPSPDPDRRAAAAAARLIRRDRDLTLLAAARLADQVRAAPDLPRVGIFLAGWHGNLAASQAPRSPTGQRDP